MKKIVRIIGSIILVATSVALADHPISSNIQFDNSLVRISKDSKNTYRIFGDVSESETLATIRNLGIIDPYNELLKFDSNSDLNVLCNLYKYKSLAINPTNISNTYVTRSPFRTITVPKDNFGPGYKFGYADSIIISLTCIK